MSRSCPGELHGLDGTLVWRDVHLRAEGLVRVFGDQDAGIVGDHPRGAEAIEVIVIGRRA